MLDKLRTLRAHHLKAFHNTTFYPYQERISDAIISALLQNLRLTSSATEEDIKRLKSIEVPIEISRQCIAGGVLISAVNGKQTGIEYIKTGDHVLTYDSSTLVDGIVEDVWETGVKDCFQLVSRNGKAIIATENHQFLTRDGYKSIQTGLKIGRDEVALVGQDTIYWDKLYAINAAGRRKTYDMTVSGTHNYVANGFITHNSGKTTAVVLTVEFVMIYLTKMFDRRIHIGIFAPQHEQAKTDFDRLKEAFNRSSQLFVAQDVQEQKEYQEQNNARTLVLPNGSSCYIFPVTKTSKPESKSLDLMIFEESQDLDDRIVKEQVWPMGANRNSPHVYIGTAGTRICYFRKLGQRNDAIKLYFEEIASQRREIYERTGDALHLMYEQYVRQQIEKHGLDADEIQRPFFGKWLIGTGNFITEEELMAMVDDRGITQHYNKSACFAGIDVAKHPDSTVVTILRESDKLSHWTLPDKTEQSAKRKEVLSWLELKGENYQNQFDIIKDYLGRYNVVAVAIDATGVGDYLPDMFENNTEWRDENSGLYRVKFSAVTKDVLYKNLKVSIKQLLTTVPKLDTKIGERFKQQMLDLQQEYKGQLLSVHHPDSASASGVKESELHDDFCDSLALAEWAYAKWTADNGPQLIVVSGGVEERKVKKNDRGEVEDYWPGSDW